MAREKSHRISISLDDNDYKAIATYAATQDASIAWVVRRAVHEFIARNPPEQRELPIDSLR